MQLEPAEVTITVALARLELPPAPVHVKLYVLLPSVVGLMLKPALLLVACVPLQAPLAMHDVALVLLQVKLLLLPLTMLLGLAVIVAVGAGVPPVSKLKMIVEKPFIARLMLD